MYNSDCVVFVTVRTASKRLPKKALRQINNKPLIQILAGRIGTSNFVKKLIVCTTRQKSDDKLVKILKKNNVSVFRGDNVDILNRLYMAAKKYKIKQFIVVEGDDFFCDLLLVKQTWNKLSQKKYDFLSWEDVPFGASPVGIKTEKLLALIKKKTKKNTETGWIKVIRESGLFKVGTLKPKIKKLKRPDIRLSIDYMEDFNLAERIYERLPEGFTLIDIINIINKNPDLLKINYKVKQKYKQYFARKMTKL